MKFKLTKKRLEVLDLAATGMTEREISYKLGLSVVTVNRRFIDIYAHYGVNNRIRAVLCYLKSTGALNASHPISGVPTK